MDFKWLFNFLQWRVRSMSNGVMVETFRSRQSVIKYVLVQNKCSFNTLHRVDYVAFCWKKVHRVIYVAT